ncbi:MAG: phenylacetate--CoA ligase family protein [Clostridia bacterium]|nr:phenylacetate--CoA ligase family protein [Clostridia bacterium]
MNYLKLLLKLYGLKRNTHKTVNQIQALQQKKLRKILKYAYINSEYYNKTFSNQGINLNNIDKFPIGEFPTVDKTVLIKNFDSIVTVKELRQEELRSFDCEENKNKKLFKGKYHIVHSSGSTGKPAYFLYDDKAWEYMLLGVIRAALWNMSMPQILKYLFKGPRIMYVAATDGRYGGAMAVGDGIEGVKGNQLFLDINTPLNKWISRTEEFKPDMIVGYPSAIKILGELVETEKLNVNVFRVISCGEPLSINLRRYFERVFKSDVINYYGASESLILGVESDIKEGMCLFDDMNYIENHNGQMYITSLYNYAQPLIRYKINDRLILKSDKGVKYPFTAAESIQGRDEDILWFEDDKGGREFLHPLAIEGFCIEGLLDYQFSQLSKNSFEMLAEASNDNKKDFIKSEMLNMMKKILYEKNLDYVQFSIKFVNSIMPDKQTGKKKLIIKGDF